MSKYLCIGVPYFLGEVVPGRDEVQQVRASGLLAELQAEWMTLEADFSSTDDPIIAVNRALAQTIAQHSASIPLVFGSDCVLALGMMKGLEAHQPDVLWYDAHGDFNTPETTVSGFIGGMPLATLVGYGNEPLRAGLDLTFVPEYKVTLSDARNLDPAEGLALANSQITHLKQVSEILHKDWGAQALYIHLDLDVVDAAEMPAHSYPELNGPALQTVAQTLQHVRSHANVVGILVDLWDQRLPGAERALSQTLQLIRAITGLAQ